VTCPYMHKLCKKIEDCGVYVCRAFFPEKQPIIDKNTLPLCQSSEYESECLQYQEGAKWQEDRRVKGLTEKCPFAQANRCGRPWEWWCKGGNYPFLLTPYEIREGTDDIPVRDENGDIKFLEVDYDIHESCLSGDPEIYTTCPHYKTGMELREYVRELKKKGKK